MTHRITIKSSGGGKLRVRHVDVDRRPTDGELDELAKSVAERLGKRVARRPAAESRKKTAARAKVEVDV